MMMHEIRLKWWIQKVQVRFCHHLLHNFMWNSHEFCVNNNTNKGRLFDLMNKVNTIQIMYILQSTFVIKFF